MARLPRLALAGHTHLVLQGAHPGLTAAGQPLFLDGLDRLSYRHALFAAAAEADVSVLAYALHDHQVRLLLTPDSAPGLSRLMQSLGGRYVGAYHRRHGGKGTLWDGRFRAAVVEPGPWRLAALRWVDGAVDLPRTHAPPAAAAEGDVGTCTSGSQRLGGSREPGLHDPPEWWSLGNTPFEREAAYRALLAQGLPNAQASALRAGTLAGWALGSAAFAEQVAQTLGRPARPRARGRPRKSPGADAGPAD